MNLKNYINSRMFVDATGMKDSFGIDEAISSGRMRSKGAAAMPESLQLNDIMSWLENIGVPMLKSPSKFNINYFFTNNGQNFVVLFPETKQHSEIGFIFKISPSGFTYPMRMEEEGEPPTHYNGGDRSQNEMFFYKIYSLATNGSINEAISSGKHGKYAPSKGCSVEDIVKWLENNGVEGHDWNNYKQNNRIATAEPGKIVYQIGPCDTPGHSWVSVCINVKENGRRTLQRVLLHTNDNTFYAQNGQEHKISFENGVRAVERMIENPNELVPENVFLGIKDSSGINEAISSGKHGKYEYPSNFNDMVDWIESFGCHYTDHFDEKPKKPQYYTNWGEDMVIIRAYLNNLLYQIRMEFTVGGKKLFWIWISERKNIKSSGKDIYDSQKEKDIETALSYTEEILTGKFNG